MTMKESQKSLQSGTATFTTVPLWNWSALSPAWLCRALWVHVGPRVLGLSSSSPLCRLEFWMMNEWMKSTTAGRKKTPMYNVHTMPQKDRHWHRWIGHWEKKLFLCLFRDVSVCAFAACLMCRWHSVTQSAVKLACYISVLSGVWYHRQWAVSSFSPVGLPSSNGMRMCVLVCVCVWTEWT